MRKVIFIGIIILSLITNHFLLLFGVLMIGCVVLNLAAIILGIIGKITGNNSLLINFLNKLKDYDIEVGYGNLCIHVKLTTHSH